MAKFYENGFVKKESYTVHVIGNLTREMVPL